MIRRFIIAAAVISYGAGGSMYAQSVNSDKEMEIDQIVVTGTGTHRRASNSPVPVKVITPKDLKDTQVVTLEEALTKLTSNITTVTNGMGTFLNINGIGDDYLLLLENGKRITGDDRFQRINMANVKRIEILSGAASALYGSEAMGGVINIITNDDNEGMSVSNNTKLLSKGRFDEQVDVDFRTGKFGSSTSFHHNEADNWQVNKYDEAGYKTGRPMSTGFRAENVNQRFTWNFNDKLQVYLRGNYNDNDTRRPESATYYKKSSKKDENGDYIYTETQAYTYNLLHNSFNIGAGMKYKISPKAYIDADVYTDNYISKYEYFKKSGNFVPGDKETRKKTHYYNGTVKGILRPNSWNKVSVGVEYIMEHLKSQSDNIEFKGLYTYNVFAQDEVTIAKGLQAVAGVRYIYNENFHSHATPNAALFYSTGGFRARAQYAGGFRTPTLSQLYATDEAKTTSRKTLGNPNLKPEKSDFFSLNAEYSCHLFSVSVTGFYNKIRDMINYRVLSEQEIADMGLQEMHENFETIRQRDNVDKATLKGVNVNANIYFGYGFTLSGGYTFTDSEAKTLSFDSKTQRYFTEKTPVDKSVKNTAYVRANWTHTWKDYRLNVNLNGHIQGERYSSTYGYAPKYQQWDLNTRHTFQFDDFTLEPGIGVENLFNERDTRPWNSNFSTVNPGRSVYISLAMKFNK